jgi:hypothetical protein
VPLLSDSFRSPCVGHTIKQHANKTPKWILVNHNNSAQMMKLTFALKPQSKTGSNIPDYAKDRIALMWTTVIIIAN